MPPLYLSILAILLILLGFSILSFTIFNPMKTIAIIAAMIFFAAIIIVKVASYADDAMNKIMGNERQKWVRKTLPNGKHYWFPAGGIKVGRTVK